MSDFSPATDLFVPAPDRVGKLIRLLSSSQDGEALGAARALGRLLDGAGGFHHLADVVERNWCAPISVRRNVRPRPEWQLHAEELLKHPDVLFTEYPDEIDFLTNISHARSAPSEAQEKWMQDISDAIARGITREQRQRERRWGGQR